jgi:hypothetical protein
MKCLRFRLRTLILQWISTSCFDFDLDDTTYHATIQLQFQNEYAEKLCTFPVCHRQSEISKMNRTSQVLKYLLMMRMHSQQELLLSFVPLETSAVKRSFSKQAKQRGDFKFLARETWASVIFVFARDVGCGPVPEALRPRTKSDRLGCHHMNSHFGHNA